MVEAVKHSNFHECAFCGASYECLQLPCKRPFECWECEDRWEREQLFDSYEDVGEEEEEEIGH